MTTPLLTPVALPLYVQGMRAVEAVADLLAGQPVPDPVVQQSRLIVHQFVAKRQADMLRDIGRALITTFNVDKLARGWPSNCRRSAS